MYTYYIYIFEQVQTTNMLDTQLLLCMHIYTYIICMHVYTYTYIYTSYIYIYLNKVKPPKHFHVAFL